MVMILATSDVNKLSAAHGTATSVVMLFLTGVKSITRRIINATFPDSRVYNAQSKISIKISRTLKRIYFLCLMLTAYSVIFKNHNCYKD